MAISSAVPLPRGCSCGADPKDLPVVLLSASVDNPRRRPPLMALTVNYEARQWRAEALARHILEWVPDFALRRHERENLSVGRLMAVVRQAVNATFGNGRDRGVPGEILLHAVCRQFFGSDTVINKVWFKTAVNDTYKGFDGVHCVHHDNELELWLGEAKFYRDISQAIRAALADLDEHLRHEYIRGEFALIADKIEDDHPHAAQLRALMHPNTSLDDVFSRIVIPVLIAYDSPVTGQHNKVCTEYRSDLKAEVQHAWMRFATKMNSDLPVTVRLLLVPMASKQLLLDALAKELAPYGALPQ